MTKEEFNKVKNEIIAFCEEHNLNYEVSSDKREYAFVHDAGYEAIDCRTLESPNCIYTEQYIIIQFPQYNAPLNHDDYYKYSDLVLELTSIASPDYMIGAENGVCKGIMYCVWG